MTPKATERAMVVRSGGVTNFDSWNVFVPYSSLHLITVATCAGIIAATTFLGRALRPKGSEAKLRHAIAYFAAGYFVSYNVWWNWKGVDLIAGLPLHICDLNAVVAPFALLTQNRWARATLYFWSFALTLQAFIQPLLNAGPASAVFWTFWTEHTIVMTCAVYDIAVLGFRPDWNDFRRAAIVSTVYLALILPLDLWLGANYGFVGNPAPSLRTPPFIAALGPWPGRLLVLAALVALAYVLILLPWRLVERFKRRNAHG